MISLYPSISLRKNRHGCFPQLSPASQSRRPSFADPSPSWTRLRWPCDRSPHRSNHRCCGWWWPASCLQDDTHSAQTGNISILKKKVGKWYMNKCWVDADYDFCRAKMEIYWDMATNMRWLLGNSPAKWRFSAKHDDELTSGFGSPSFANHISRVLSFPMDPNTSWEGTANPREKIPQTLPKKAFGSIGRDRERYIYIHKHHNYIYI